MNKTKNFIQAVFSPEVIRQAVARLESCSGYENESKRTTTLNVKTPEGEWNHDSEDEFFADYRRTSGNARFEKGTYGHSLELRRYKFQSQSWTEISVQGKSRAEIEGVFEVFEQALSSSQVPLPSATSEPPPPPPIIFIGHGGSLQWRDLKDHLQDKHGYSVMAYEIGARAGHEIRDILYEMLSKSAFALLVMTGEDPGSNGKLRAQQNVVHELGLFQGRIGFTKAAVLLEEGTEEFSNMNGVHQIRYAKGRIQETFGEVLATLRREFS